MCLLLLVIIITDLRSEKGQPWISFAQTHLSVQQIFGESVKKKGESLDPSPYC